MKFGCKARELSGEGDEVILRGNIPTTSPLWLGRQPGFAPKLGRIAWVVDF
jgi:hypothetical protein